MANLGIYATMNVYINSQLLTQETSCTVSINTNSNAVNTVVGGYSGESPGASSVEIDVENAVPDGDFELVPDEYLQGLKPVDVTLFSAGRTLTVQGFIISYSVSHSVSAAASISFKFRGRYDGKWE